jgi:hypothetical protein
MASVPAFTLLLALALATGAGATTCSGNTYSFGSGACASCPDGATLNAATGACRPSAALTAGPDDAAFYLSGTQAEGVAAFAGARDVAFATGVFGAANGSLLFASSASYLIATPAAGSALLASLPTGDAPFTASAWLKCPKLSNLTAFSWGQTTMPWGAQSAGGSTAAAVTLAAGALAYMAPPWGAGAQYLLSGANFHRPWGVPLMPQATSLLRIQLAGLSARFPAEVL